MVQEGEAHPEQDLWSLVQVTVNHPHLVGGGGGEEVKVKGGGGGEEVKVKGGGGEGGW